MKWNVGHTKKPQSQFNENQNNGYDWDEEGIDDFSYSAGNEVGDYDGVEPEYVDIDSVGNDAYGAGDVDEEYDGLDEDGEVYYAQDEVYVAGEHYAAGEEYAQDEEYVADGHYAAGQEYAHDQRYHDADGYYAQNEEYVGEYEDLGTEETEYASGEYAGQEYDLSGADYESENTGYETIDSEYESEDTGYEPEDTGYETNWIAKQLANQLLWDIDMSEERFSELYDRALHATYGDGAPLVRGFVTTIDRIHEATKCTNCWGFGVYSYPDYLYSLYVDPDGVAEYYDLMFELLEAAIPLARYRRQEQRCVALQAGLIYKGSVAAYPLAQKAGDTERMAELSRRYTLMRERLLKFGVDITNRSQLIGWSGNAHPATIEELYPEGEGREKLISPKPFD